MYIKMPVVKTHPHMYTADFINKYQNQIKPLLEERDIEAANVGIADVYFRACKAFEDFSILDWKERAYERYESAITKLRALSAGKIPSSRVLNFILSMINRDVMELELILQGDEIYEKYRQREEAK